MPLTKKLHDFVTTISTETITEQRKQTLQPLIDYIQSKVVENQPIRLNFICTHNSRRSHLSQIWAKTMAYYFGVNNVTCYSGGTEATSLFPMIKKTLKETGFEIKKLSENKNPIYSIKYSDNELPIIGFSKKIDDTFNPKSEFCAVMTCSHADKNCPIVMGAEKRIPITFEDPKQFDNSPQQAEKYHERSLQIATEMFYIFSQKKG